MKTRILLIICLFPMIGMAQTKISIADGDWSDPQTWFPTGVPATQSDSIIIKHEIAVYDVLEIQATLWIQETGFLLADETFALHGDLLVDGEIEAQRLAVGDGVSFSNYGYIDVETFITTNDLNSNFNTIYSDTIYLTDHFMNSTSALLDCIALYSTGSSIENNGTISTGSWVHNDNISGLGVVCIQDCFINNGSINGNLDICDMTPNGSGGMPCDINTGTVAPTVTFCQNSVCGSPTGISKKQASIDVNIYPNPIRRGAILNIELGSKTNFSLTLTDALGNSLHSQQGKKRLTKLETNTFPTGIYFLTIANLGEALVKRKIIIQ